VAARMPRIPGRRGKTPPSQGCGRRPRRRARTRSGDDRRRGQGTRGRRWRSGNGLCVPGWMRPNRSAGGRFEFLW